MHRKGDVRERFVKRYVVRNEMHTILDDIDVNDDVKNKRYICVATHEKHGSCRRPAEGK